MNKIDGIQYWIMIQLKRSSQVCQIFKGLVGLVNKISYNVKPIFAGLRYDDTLA